MKSEKSKFHKPTEMFLDVLDKPSRLMERQRDEFVEHIKQHVKDYPMLSSYEKI
jgi:hypothetical protein